MLVHLDGRLNVAGSPQENFAREFFELFTVGKGDQVSPTDYTTFTETDVKEATRLLTGWDVDGSFTLVDPITGIPRGKLKGNGNIATQHDTGTKTFTAAFNNTSIAPASNQVVDVEAELDAFVDMVFASPHTAKFICRKLYRFFVYHNIDAQTEQNVIEPLAQIFRDNNYDIVPVLSALLKSEHFFDQLNRGAVIKSPIDQVVGFYRQMGVTFPGAADLTDTLYLSYVTNFVLAEMLQTPGDPPNVAGWQAYYQQPVYDKLWINSSTLPRRGQINEYLLFVGLYGANNVAKPDVLAFTESLNNPGDPDLLLAEVHELLLGLPVAVSVVNYHKAVLLSNLPSAYYWTLAWEAYLANPTDPIIRGEVENRLKILYHVIIQTEEYQLA
jgi:uncharacterized protein (DUF1800 family)